MRQNNFEKIYQAAIQQNADLLPTGGYCIDEHAEGQYDYSAISRCAQENNRDAVEWLLKQGAQINYAAYGAGFGGHSAYADELLGRMHYYRQHTGLKSVAMGAGAGGHQAYADELLKRATTLYGPRTFLCEVAQCAARRGHQAYADELLERGAKFKDVVIGAAQGGHEAYVEDLLMRGADIDDGPDFLHLATRTASQCGYLKNPQTQLTYLPYFKPHEIDQAITEYRAPKPTSEVLKRIRCMSRHMHEGGLTRAEALARTDKSLYYFLLLSSMHKTQKGNFKKTPSFLMLRIGSFLASSLLSPEKTYGLSLQVSKDLLTQCLVQYQQSSWSLSTRHKERAESFKTALAHASDRKGMVSLIKNQFSLLSGVNPYPQDQQDEKYKTSTTTRPSDGYFKIVSRWHKQINGSAKHQKLETVQEGNSETAQESKSETAQESKSEATPGGQSETSATSTACTKR